MKFILLRKKDNRTPYDIIIKHGCGPNFVLKREKKFRIMMQEQGETFWFRFWLTVFYNPTCDYFQMIQENFPHMVNNVHKYTHHRFLQVSSRSAADYCINVIRQLKIVPHENQVIPPCGVKTEQTIELQKLQDIICTAAHVTFGVALCVVFYNWLKNADLKTQKPQQDYWVIPPEYLDQEFQPKLLEQFLADVWKEKLAELLGVNIKEIPWLKRLLTSNNNNIPMKHDPVQNHALTKVIKDTAEELRFLQNQSLKAVMASDEGTHNSRRGYQKMIKKLKTIGLSQENIALLDAKLNIGTIPILKNMLSTNRIKFAMELKKKCLAV
uniref:Uncharacterized protein n=1 Tax=Strigamia maritima TaxID=126957 RepID=T1IPM8_STRMM